MRTRFKVFVKDSNFINFVKINSFYAVSIESTWLLITLKNLEKKTPVKI